MPIVQIEMLEGRTLDQKREMVRRVCAAITESLNCPKEVVRIVIREMKKENFARGDRLVVDE